MNKPGDLVYIKQKCILAKFINVDDPAKMLKTYLDDSDFLIAEDDDILFLIERANDDDDEWIALHASGILVYAFYDAYKTFKL